MDTWKFVLLGVVAIGIYVFSTIFSAPKKATNQKREMEENDGG
jgi:hypothetical protein